MASTKQLQFISRLCDERQVDLETFNGYQVDEAMTNRMVDEVLAYLKSLPRPARQETAKAERQPVEPGMYQMDGTIYKVQLAVHGSGRPYAKRLDVVGVADGAAQVVFERAPGVVYRLRPEHRMTLEEAKEFGALYGTCVRCGATLTDENSIADGIGPVCAGKI